MNSSDDRGGIGKVLLLIIGGFFAIAVIASLAGDGGDGGRDGGGGDQEKVQQVAVPGEATIEIGDSKTLTRITGVEVRGEAIPGNEFAQAPEGKAYMIFKAEIQNLGTEDLDVNSTVYRLKTPSGEIINFTSIGGPQELSFGTTLTQGASKAGELSFEVPAPTPGQEYVLLWKPNPFTDHQAQFTYRHA